MKLPLSILNNKEDFRKILEQCWSSKTSVGFDPANAPRSYCQCAPTSLVIQEAFGGDLLKTAVKKYDGTFINHFYNRINGVRYDFTEDQFDDAKYWIDFKYDDLLTDSDDVHAEMLEGQYSHMKSSFFNLILLDCIIHSN